MDFIIVRDTQISAGPGHLFVGVASLPRGTIVRSIVQQDGWVRLESGIPNEQNWVEASDVQPVGDGHLPHRQPIVNHTSGQRSSVTSAGEVAWSWGPRLAGSVQMFGGILEVALGIGGAAIPEPATTVGGVILIAHGSDTIVAGFRTLSSGKVTHSFTQTGTTMAAEGLGASPEMARNIGIGADFVAGVGPSIGVAVTRRLAIAGAERASNRVAVAYLHRNALQMGHNAVGVRTSGTTAWVHFAGLPRGAVETMRRGPGSQYIITELAVNGGRAARAVRMQQTLLNAGVQTWRYTGPNCTTTAMQVLRQGGVIVPAWSVSPGLLHLGVKAGGEITFMAGAISSTAPDFVPSARSGSVSR